MISLNYAKVQPFKIRLPNWLLYPGLPTLQDICYLTQVGGNCSEYFSQTILFPDLGCIAAPVIIVSST